MASSPKDDLDAAAEPLREEVAALRSDVAEFGKMVARVGKERAAGLKAAAETAAGEGYARGGEAVDRALSELRSFEDEVAGATQRHPFAAIGLAALVGFLVGLLMRR